MPILEEIIWSKNEHHVRILMFFFMRCKGGRAVHDGFATVRSGGGKRGRARSSPSMTSDIRTTACHHGCCNSGGRTWAMEPLWEEKGVVDTTEVLPISRRDRSQLPWWEVATRRSRYRSCPTFSQVCNKIIRYPDTKHNFKLASIRYTLRYKTQVHYLYPKWLFIWIEEFMVGIHPSMLPDPHEEGNKATC